MALPDRATNILNVLHAEQCDRYPIIFVCHSLGGLVVKQLLRIASDQLGTQFGHILARTQGVVFFATPNTGSDVATWMDKLRSVLRPTAATLDLQADSAYLRDLNYWYRDHAPKDDIATQVFVESEQTHGVAVVDMISGDPGIPGVRPIPIDANHVDICKFKSKDDPVYKSVLRFVDDRVPASAVPAAVQPSVSGKRHIFISYRRRAEADAKLADTLRTSLQVDGHEVFIDVGMHVGVEWGKEITKRIEWCDFLIVLLSEESIASEMVLEEVRLAHERRKKDNTPIILPVRVNYNGALGYALGAYLNPFQQVTWDGPASDDDVFDKIRQAIGAVPGQDPVVSTVLTSPPSIAAQPAPSLHAQIRARPQSIADPRMLRQPGGVIRLDDPCYIQRSPDRGIMISATDTGVTSVISAPRQMGKSSLLFRYFDNCRKYNKKIVFIDFQLFSDSEIATQEILLSKLAEKILRELSVDPSAMRKIEGPGELTDFFEDVVFKATPSPITLAFDEVDRIIDKPYRTNFFAMLRGWHGRRAIEGRGWERLDLALVVSTEPQFFIEDVTQSPFNVVEPVRLEYFEQTHLAQMNDLFGKPVSDDELAELLELLGGHPYLTRLAFYRLAQDPTLTFANLCQRAADDDGPFGEHLRARVSQLGGRPELLQAMAGLVMRGIAPKLPAFYRLKAAGLVRRDRDGKTVPANAIYKSFLARALA
jgi:AAA-like domain/TIR domain